MACNRGNLLLITAENAAALHAVEEGLKLAEASGVHLWDFMLLAQGVWARVTANDLAGAEAALVRLRSILILSGIWMLFSIIRWRFALRSNAMIHT